MKQCKFEYHCPEVLTSSVNTSYQRAIYLTPPTHIPTECFNSYWISDAERPNAIQVPSWCLVQKLLHSFTLLTNPYEQATSSSSRALLTKWLQVLLPLKWKYALPWQMWNWSNNFILWPSKDKTITELLHIGACTLLADEMRASVLCRNEQTTLLQIMIKLLNRF